MSMGRPLLAAGMMLIAGCGFSAGAGKSVDRSDVEQQVADRLSATVGQKPTAVTCPGDLKAKKGAKMRCRLEASDGTNYGVTVTVTSVDDGRADFRIQVDDKPLST
ncbi:DUF4333 domain-containing protein [Actinoallomurus acaciae]|uniref:DUF4333 domain-containing protein n=1 Tax=Actinoallomurus acaciae TaxID=502577 RepID=A0ABV5YVN5_9ACTN